MDDWRDDYKELQRQLEAGEITEHEFSRKAHALLVEYKELQRQLEAGEITQQEFDNRTKRGIAMPPFRSKVQKITQPSAGDQIPESSLPKPQSFVPTVRKVSKANKYFVLALIVTGTALFIIINAITDDGNDDPVAIPNPSEGNTVSETSTPVVRRPITVAGTTYSYPDHPLFSANYEISCTAYGGYWLTSDSRCLPERVFYDIVILETWAFLNMGYDDLPLDPYPYLYSLPVAFPEEDREKLIVSLYQNTTDSTPKPILGDFDTDDMTALNRWTIEGFMNVFLSPDSVPYLYEGENAYRNRLCVLDVRSSASRDLFPLIRELDPNASALSADDLREREIKLLFTAVGFCPRTPEYLISETYFLELYAAQIKAFNLYAHLLTIQGISIEDYDGVFEDFIDHNIAKCLILRENAIKKYSTERRQLFTAWDDVTVPASVKNCFPSSTLP